VVNGEKRILRLVLDTHYRQVTVAMQEDGGRIKVAGKKIYADFGNWVQKKLEEGWRSTAATKPEPPVIGFIDD
jgi:hypothetical protein